MQKCRFYRVPAKESVHVGHWEEQWANRKAEAMQGTWDEVSGMQILPTVKDMIKELRMQQDEVFEWSPFFMTRKATKAVHDLCWKHIGKDIAKRNARDEYPILIWDLDSVTKHVTEERQATLEILSQRTADRSMHVKFWKTAVQWGLAACQDKHDLVKQLNQVINGKTDAPRICLNLYNQSRLKVIRYRDAEAREDRICDETQLDASDEHEDVFYPARMPGNIVTEKGVVGSKLWSEREAEQGGWPENEQVKQWTAILQGLLTKLMGANKESLIRSRIESAQGEYRMYFAAILAARGFNEHTQSEVQQGEVQPDFFLKLGREMSDVE